MKNTAASKDLQIVQKDEVLLTNDAVNFACFDYD